MSLRDLIPVALSTAMPRRRLTRTEIQRRYRMKHRAKLNAYRREWYRNRRIRELTERELDHVVGW